ncbi:hypothetical protein Scep_004369 [Stephania cephalantha]|uniref:Uncharacterized protein n=1 Tax=Stephania cephalantha TaxID=152367 RepID=A0AAP0PWL8_9MAGN
MPPIATTANRSSSLSTIISHRHPLPRSRPSPPLPTMSTFHHYCGTPLSTVTTTSLVPSSPL